MKKRVLFYEGIDIKPDPVRCTAQTRGKYSLSPRARYCVLKIWQTSFLIPFGPADAFPMSRKRCFQRVSNWLSCIVILSNFHV